MCEVLPQFNWIQRFEPPPKHGYLASSNVGSFFIISLVLIVTNLETLDKF